MADRVGRTSWLTQGTRSASYVGIGFVSLLLVSASPCRAREKRHAPLQPQLLSAKTVFLSGGPPNVLDKAYAELRKWGRFQVVSNPAQADVILTFSYEMVHAATPMAVQGTFSETFTITDAKTAALYYQDGRVATPGGNGSAAATMASVFHHYSMAQEMLKDLRKRIEAEESARDLEDIVGLTAKFSKLFADLSTLDEQLAIVDPSSELKKQAMEWKALADKAEKDHSDAARFLANASDDDLLGKRILKTDADYRSAILPGWCPTVKVTKANDDRVDKIRASLSPPVIQALDTVEADVAGLTADCSPPSDNGKSQRTVTP